MADRTSSSRRRNPAAPASVVLGLVAVAVVPAAVVYLDRRADVELIWAAAAIPVALAAGFAAMAIARRAQRRAQLTLRRRSGGGVARAGRALGLLGILVAATGLLSLAVYAVLVARGRS